MSFFGKLYTAIFGNVPATPPPESLIEPNFDVIEAQGGVEEEGEEVFEETKRTFVLPAETLSIKDYYES